MRIAYILTSLGIGGAEKQVISIAERMEARGHHVALVVLKDPEKQEWPTTLTIHRLGVTKFLPSAIGGVPRARRILQTIRPDLLHSHTFPANMMARALRATGSAPLVISTIHNVYEGNLHRTFAYRLTDRLTVCSTAVSRAVAEQYIKSKAVPQKKISVLTNGIDTDAFSPSRSLADQAGNLPPHRSDKSFVWLAAGRDVPAKDFDNLLAAFRILRASMPKAELCIAGQPSPHRNNEAGVQWLGLSANMPETLARCDAFVLSSAWEGLPLVIAEAMSMEKPVVATHVGGVREFIRDKSALVPPKAPEELADAMLRIMRLPEPQRHEMGRQARAIIHRDFNINTKVDEWEALYSSVLRANEKAGARDSGLLRE
ncbi:glycosyltransferase [Occallatibacter savannae]|uniref:glycosyltransferase n=1 Tax=Occallatibacter savannae TaxID=1002691 RepID=UPI000D68D609|nr:glycosyltransferase [Occallatibacter savannae]